MVPDVTVNPTISFLTDYGYADEFVGVVKSVLRRLAPEALVLDLTHDIPPHDIRAGALALRRAVSWLAPGVVLAVVDPGVGTVRRALAVEPAQGDSLVFVAPDNGLLLPALTLLGGVARAVALPAARYPVFSDPVVGGGPAAGPTFDGRDLFAPAAAALARGADLADLGEEVDPAGLVPGPESVPRPLPGGVACDVLWVDRFGNAQLGVSPSELDRLGTEVEVHLADRLPARARRARAFADLAPGELGLVVDSSGLPALVLDQAPAASRLGIAPGTEVVLRRPGEPGARPKW
jgi:S-adenosylmethionine hydrolase